MKMFLVFCIIVLVSCDCKKYAYSTIKNPVFRSSYRQEICKGVEMMVGFGGTGYETGQYKLPNDSLVTGYTAGVNLLYINSRKMSKVLVGEGSEFYAGKCKFRVLEVDPFYYLDSTNDYHSPHITIQTIAYPKFCRCENEKLKEFDKELKNEINE